ncbi:efflux RND transporter periplasmic adaptor subunit [Agrobacterium tumefaciens]|uniref:efflux RND transporter periplasmic adaptor subunit n=1 Tax=Agrobacterium tumefaciens TaxID=358 RepID=UPI001572A293|nr:efflux RND transporter periplasmic adaptor subunit [Agrobacterium tumefaciens]NTA84197.1 efflux RND transporter periplasmic adaptor subunit [Agrobacterium tumefaciens]
MKRKFLLATVALAALAGVAAAIVLLPPATQDAVAADPRTLPPLVSLAMVKTPDAANRTFTGTVAARVQSDLGFRVPGKIVERLVGVGEQVKSGQPLLRIDSNDLNLSLTAKRNAVIAAQATFVQAQADEKRFAALVKSNAASTQQYERAKAALDTAAAQLSAAKADATVAENEVTYAVLLADADGTIVETLVEPGQVVSAGQPVIRLAKAGPREALVWMPETMRPAIGTVARARIYGQSGQETAVLRQISDAADQQTRTYETRWVLQGAAAAAPLGATVTIGVENSTHAHYAEVPLGAVLDDGSRTGVWVFNDKTSTVHFRPVAVERIGEETAFVTDVRSGETVVALGAHLLQDGASVRTDVEKAEAAN